MERKVGTVSRGIRCPIIRQGDDLANIVVTSVLEAAEQEGFQLRDKDVISVTESVVARAQGNYASVDDIAADVRASSAPAPSASSCPSSPATALPSVCGASPKARTRSSSCSATPATRWATAW